MSYLRGYSILLLKALLLGLLLAGAVHAEDEEEKSRTWTSSSGKKILGVMKSYGDDWVQIQVKGKLYKLPLEKLSKPDQDYVAAAKSKLKVTLKLVTVNDNDLDYDRRTLSITFRNVPEDEEVYCLVVWIATAREGRQTGLKSSMEAFIDRNSTEDFEVGFSNHKELGDIYRGYAVRLIDEEGKVIKEYSSSGNMLKYLDEAPARQAPKPSKKKEEDGDEEEDEDDDK